MRALIAIALLVVSNGCRPQEGRARLVFDWQGQRPDASSELYLLLKVEDRSRVPATVLAENAPVRLGENYLAQFPAIEHGPGRVVVAEVHTSRFSNSRIVFYGVSAPFDFSAGDAHEIVTLMQSGSNHEPEAGPEGPDLDLVHYERAPWGQDGGPPTYRVRADPGALAPETQAVVFAQAQVRAAVELAAVQVEPDGSFSVLLDAEIATSVPKIYVAAAAGTQLSDHDSEQEDLQVGVVPNVQWTATFGSNADAHEVTLHAAFDPRRRVQHPEQAQRLTLSERGPLAADDREFVVSEPKGVWFNRSPGDDVLGPGARARHAMAWDPARARVVLFGGLNAQREDTDETWALDEDGWRKLETEVAPSRRFSFDMTYDSARDRMVLFGGVSEGVRSDDTWVFDGGVWRRIAAAGPRPSPRENARLVYDSRRGRVILFGGLGSSGPGLQVLADTWVLEGQEWREVTTSVAPLPRTNFDMAYDEQRDRVVLFGGSGLGPLTYSDTWEFDPEAEVWTEHLVSGPVSRSKHAMAYDPERGRVVLSGGIEDFNGALDFREDAWSWTGQEWQLTPNLNAGALRFHQIQPFLGGMLIFGGDSSEREAQATNRLWHLTSTVPPEEVVYSDEVPSPRERAALGFDSSQSKLLLQGGFDGQGWLDDTWLWSHAGWKRHELPIRPRLSDPHLVTTSSVSWLVGATADSMQTWGYEAGAWRVLTASISDFGPRSAFSVTNNRTGRGLVAFGGVDAGVAQSDTWRFDEGRWLESSSVGPEGRRGHGMVNIEGGVWLYGGRTPAGAFYNTWWRLQDEVWRHPAQTVGPSARAFFGLNYDAGRKQVLLYGGEQQGGEASGEAWQWSSEFGGWAQLQPSGASPGGLVRHAQTYHPNRASTFVFGGCRRRCVSGGRTQETWELLRSPDQRSSIEIAVEVPTELLQIDRRAWIRIVTSEPAELLLWQARTGRWHVVGDIDEAGLELSLPPEVVQAGLGGNDSLYFVARALGLEELGLSHAELTISATTD